MPEIGVFFLILFMEFPTYDWNQHILLTHKTKKMNKIEKYADFGHELGKLESNLKKITKMGKMKSEKFMKIFAFQYRF